MGEVSGGLLLVSGEQRVCCGLSNLLTKACDLIGPNPPYPAISLGKGQDKSVGTRKTNKLQMWSEVQSGKRALQGRKLLDQTRPKFTTKTKRQRRQRQRRHPQRRHPQSDDYISQYTVCTTRPEITIFQ